MPAGLDYSPRDWPEMRVRAEPAFPRPPGHLISYVSSCPVQSSNTLMPQADNHHDILQITLSLLLRLPKKSIPNLDHRCSGFPISRLSFLSCTLPHAIPSVTFPFLLEN